MIKEYHVSENLYNYATNVTGYRIQWTTGNSYADATAIMSDYIPVSAGNYSLDTGFIIVGYDTNKAYVGVYRVEETWEMRSSQQVTLFKVAANSGVAYVKLLSYGDYPALSSTNMLNLGSTSLPYEPYGNTWNTKSYCKATTGSETYSNFPIVVRSQEQSITSWNMKGNEQHTGTASPTSPIEINGTGDRTENLFDKSGSVTYDSGVSLTVLSTGVRVTTTTSGTNKYKGIILSNDLLGKTLTVSMSISVSGNNDSAVRLYFVNGRTPTDYITRLFGSTDIGQKQVTFTMPNIIPTGSNGIAILFSSNYSSVNGEIGDYADYIDIMINEGSTAIPYEPYGYKIPISANGTALTPVYLTEPLMLISTYADSLASSGTVTYQIKKIVLTGSENWTYHPLNPSGYFRYLFSQTVIAVSDVGICTHYTRENIGTATVGTDVFTINAPAAGGNGIVVSPTGIENMTTDSWKTYLAEQYAAGTPVTVYYVLATPTTEQVTVPTIPTTSSPTTIDVNTSVKPSEMSLTYDGYKICKEQKYQNNTWT